MPVQLQCVQLITNKINEARLNLSTFNTLVKMQLTILITVSTIVAKIPEANFVCVEVGVAPQSVI